MSEEKRTVALHTEFIRLDQLLKFAGLFPTGGACKEAITGGSVTVNGEVCLMRGKKIREGDEIRFGGITLEVIRS